MIPLFVLGHFSHHIMTAITVPLIPFIRGAFGLDYAQSGLVVSAEVARPVIVSADA